MIYRALAEREVELLVAGIFGPVADEHMNTEILYDDPFVVVAGAKNPWSRRRRVRFSDLMNEPWTLPPPGSLTWPIVVEVFRAHGLDVPRAALVTSSIPTRNAMLASGRFLTLVPASVLRLAGRSREIRALPIDLPLQGRPIGIITLKNRTLGPVAQRFIAFAREVAKSIGACAGAGLA
jgi:DNA-binding transcriptional LysR family regulator